MIQYVGMVLVAGACALGGTTPAEGVLLVALILGAAGLRSQSAFEPTPRVWWTAIALLTLVFAASSAVLVARDRPIGTDWMAYLKNAVALGADLPHLYQRWRGPVHAWMLLLLTPVTGGLIEASQATSLLAAVVCVPLTGWLGFQVGGPLVGIVAASLLAGWADLRVYAVSSTPYPLVACLSLFGTNLVWWVANRASRWGWAPAGLVFGLAYGADLRAATSAVTAALGSWRPGVTRPLLLVLLLTFGVGSAAIHSLPVELIPLREQVTLQRDLNAREGLGTCPKRGNEPPTFEDLTGRCGRTTLLANLGRAGGTMPFGLELFAALFLGGLWHLRGSRLLLGLPVASLAPGLLMIGVQHRYFVPLAPGLAVIGAGALVALLGGSRLGRVGLALTTIGLAVGWHVTPGTFWSRANGPPSEGFDMAASLVAPSAFVPARAALRAAGPEDRIVDCTRADLRVRLYPHPVDTSPPAGPGQLSKLCRQLASRGPTASGTTWLFVAGETLAYADAWQVAWTAKDGPSTLVLLRAEGAAPKTAPSGAGGR